MTLLLLYIFIGALTAMGYMIAVVTDSYANNDAMDIAGELIAGGIMSISFGAIWPISLPAGYIALRRMQ